MMGVRRLVNPAMHNRRSITHDVGLDVEWCRAFRQYAYGVVVLEELILASAQATKIVHGRYDTKLRCCNRWTRSGMV